MKRTPLLVILGGVLLASLLGAVWIVGSAPVAEPSETTQAPDEATIPTEDIVTFDYADLSGELERLSNVNLGETEDEDDAVVENLPDETREAAEAGAQDGIRLAAEQGINVTAEQEQAAIDSAVRAAAENEDATPEAIRAAAKGASHGTLLQSQEEEQGQESNVTVTQIQASVYGSTAGALSQHQDATVTQLQSAAYGAAHGTTAQHQHANVTQMQHAAVGASAGATHGAVQTQQTDITQIQEAAQGGSYGALTQQQTATVTQIQAAAYGAAGGGAEKTNDRKKDPKKVQEASMGAAEGALVQRQRASVEQIQAAARGACKGALVQEQRVSVTQIQQASKGAAQGAISQSQVATVQQIQAAALGGANGVLTQVQRVDIIQIQHAAAGAAKGAAGAAAQRQVTNVDQIQAAAAGAGQGSVIQIQQINIQQVQVIAEGAARGALSQHQQASVVQLQSAAHGASEGTLSLTQVQIVNIQQIQYISERAAADTVRIAVDIDVDDERTIYTYAKGAGGETDSDPELRSLFFDVDDETLFLANPNEVTVTVTVTSEDGDVETITLSPGESLTREFDPSMYTLTAESEDGRTVEIAGREEVTVNLGSDPQSLSATVQNQTLRVENPNDDPATVTVQEGGERILRFAVPPTSERTQQLEPGAYTLTAQIAETSVPINGEDGYEISIESQEIHLDVTIDEQDVIIENPSETDVTVTAIHDETGDEQEIAVPGEATRNRTLEPGNYTLVGEADDREVFLGGQDELPISLSQPTGTFPVQIVDVTDSVEVGETLNVTAEISNDGEIEGEEEITLDIDDREGLDSATVTLGPGETETITLTYQTIEDDIGEHDVTVRSPSDIATETVEVLGSDDGMVGGVNGSDGDEGVDDSDGDEVAGVDYQAVDSCTVISESGAYELADDVEGDATAFDDGSGNACIRITASDVVLDGNDNGVEGASEEETIGILVAGTSETAAENVTIRTLRAESWDNGIQIGTTISGSGTIQDRDEARLEDVTTSENENHGVHVRDSGTVGIETIDASGNGVSGIYVDDGEAGSLVDITANDNGRYGIEISDGEAESMVDVTANGNGNDGIHVIDGKVDSMMDVTTNDNGRDGIDLIEGDVTEGEFVSMVDIIANDNGGSGVRVSEPREVVIAERITVSENDGVGVLLGTDVYSSEFSAVYASDNAAGFLIDGDSSGNVVRDSTIENNGGPGIRHGQNSRNEFRNVTVRDNEDWQVDSYDDDGTFTAAELRIGEDAEFAFDAESVSLDDVKQDEFEELPEDVQAIGDGVEVEGIENGVDVTLEYEDNEDEGQIELWRYDGTEWVRVEEDVTVADGSIESTLTEDGIYAPVLVDEEDDDQESNLDVSVNEQDITIENSNDVAVDVTAIDDETGEERLIEVPADETVTEEFEPGDYTLIGAATDERPVTLNGEDELTITVSAPDSAEFVIESIETNDPIEAGELLEVTAQIENTGEETATQEVILDVGDQDAVATDELELEGGESGTIELTYQTDEDDVGDLDVTVRTADATDTTMATIQEPEPPEEDAEDEDAEEGEDEDAEEGEESEDEDEEEQTEDEDESDEDENEVMDNISNT